MSKDTYQNAIFLIEGSEHAERKFIDLLNVWWQQDTAETDIGPELEKMLDYKFPMRGPIPSYATCDHHKNVLILHSEVYYCGALFEKIGEMLLKYDPNVKLVMEVSDRKIYSLGKNRLDTFDIDVDIDIMKFVVFYGNRGKKSTYETRWNGGSIEEFKSRDSGDKSCARLAKFWKITKEDFLNRVYDDNDDNVQNKTKIWKTCEDGTWYEEMIPTPEEIQNQKDDAFIRDTVNNAHRSDLQFIITELNKIKFGEREFEDVSAVIGKVDDLSLRISAAIVNRNTVQDADFNAEPGVQCDCWD